MITENNESFFVALIFVPYLLYLRFVFVYIYRHVLQMAEDGELSANQYNQTHQVSHIVCFLFLAENKVQF